MLSAGMFKFILSKHAILSISQFGINPHFGCVLSSVQRLSSQKRMLVVFFQSKETLALKRSSVQSIFRLFIRNPKEMLLINRYDLVYIILKAHLHHSNSFSFSISFHLFFGAHPDGAPFA